MKLPINHDYFEQIKSGKKDREFQDAHITFIDEETGEQLKKKIWGCCMYPIDEITSITPEEKKKIFEDKEQICFLLEDYNDSTKN